MGVVDDVEWARRLAALKRHGPEPVLERTRSPTEAQKAVQKERYEILFKGETFDTNATGAARTKLWRRYRRHKW